MSGQARGEDAASVHGCVGTVRAKQCGAGRLCGRGPWTKCVSSDMQSLKIQTIKHLETKSKKREHFKMIRSAYISTY